MEIQFMRRKMRNTLTKNNFLYRSKLAHVLNEGFFSRPPVRAAGPIQVDIRSNEADRIARK